MKVGIIGKGNVGKAIAAGLSHAGHEIRHGHRDPNEPVRPAAEWGEVVFLAVPYENAAEVAEEIGSLVDGKAVVDVSNAVGDDWNLAIGFSTSAGEEMQRKLPKAHVVKAFNTVFAQNQSTGRLGEESLTLFVADDDAKARQVVMSLGKDIGFDCVDTGPLKSARYLEPMGMLMINLGLVLGMGNKIGFKLVKGKRLAKNTLISKRND